VKGVQCELALFDPSETTVTIFRRIRVVSTLPNWLSLGKPRLLSGHSSIGPGSTSHMESSGPQDRKIVLPFSLWTARGIGGIVPPTRLKKSLFGLIG